MRRTGIPWDAVKKAYESGTPVVDIVAMCGVSQPNISRKAKAEGWIRPGKAAKAPMKKQTRANVIDLASRRIIASPEGQKAVEDAVVEITASLKNQPRIAKKLMELAEKVIDEALKEELVDKDGVTQKVSVLTTLFHMAGEKQGIATVLSEITRAAKTAFEVAREMNGLKIGQASAIAEDDGDEQRADFVAFNVDPEALKALNIA